MTIFRVEFGFTTKFGHAPFEVRRSFPFRIAMETGSELYICAMRLEAKFELLGTFALESGFSDMHTDQELQMKQCWLLCMMDYLILAFAILISHQEKKANYKMPHDLNLLSGI